MNIIKCPICKGQVNLDALGTKTGNFACPICGFTGQWAAAIPDSVSTNPYHKGYDQTVLSRMVD